MRSAILSLLLVFSAPPLQAHSSLLERYALASDRAAVLKDLVRGTDDYYFYHALHAQTQGRHPEAAAFLKEWEERSSGPNGRRDVLKARAAILAYSTDPGGSVA
jgi:hypothetical protein